MRVVHFISDVHYGAEDPEAVEAYTRFAEQHPPDERVWGGDILDLESCSSHGGNANPPQMVDELDYAREKIEELVTRAPAVHGETWLQGNHETRFRRLLTKQAPALASAMPTVPELLRLPEMRFERFLPYGKVYYPQASKTAQSRLGFVHGVFCGKHHASAHLERYKTSLAYGHTHRPQARTMAAQIHTQGCWETQALVSIGVGCLRTLNPEWMTAPTAWSHGFLVAYIDEDGSFTAYPIVMQDRSFIWNGVRYDGK